MGTHTQASVLSFRSIGILSFVLLQLCILKSSHAVTTAEIDLLRRQKPIQQLVDVYSDAAKFNVEVPFPIGGRPIKCGERGTHVVQLALQSNPSNFSFAYNVDQDSDGFKVKGLDPSTEYIVRVACRFNEGSPGEWSDPAYIRTGKSDGGSGHHHHHHDHDHQDGGGGGSKSGNQGAQSHGSPSTTIYYSLFIINHTILFLLVPVLLASTNFY